MKFIQLIAGVALVAVLAACGGGGGSPGVNGTGTGTTTGTTSGTTTGTTTGTTAATVTPTVADYIFELDKTTVKNSGSDAVVIGVTALDASRNVVAGVPVSVAVDSGVFSQASGAITDAGGKFTGNIGIAGDKTNRIINATITVNGIKKIASFAVIGTKITVTPVPAIPQPGQTVSLNISVRDSGDVGIPNAPVTLTGSAGFSGVVRTDLSGNLVVTAIARASGNYLAVVSASGETFSLPLSVVTPGGGGATGPLPATGVFSGPILLPNPTSIAPNTVGATDNRAAINAKFLRGDNSTIERMRVRFEILEPSLGAGEFISTGSSLVYSDASGVATADYVSGLRTSPTNGVKLRACFDYVDFPTGPVGALVGSPSCPNAVLASLTVNSKPLALSIGNFNKLETGLGGISYVQKLLIRVVDSSGVGVRDAVVSISSDITHFGKGRYEDNYYLTGGIPPKANSLNYPNAAIAAASAIVAPTFTQVIAVSTTPILVTATAVETYSPTNVPRVTYDNSNLPFVTGRVWCVNEDRNRNGTNDSGEDINGNGLEPIKSEVGVSYVSGNKTDDKGEMLIQVSYSQNMGSWLAYTIKATTSVVGSEGTTEAAFITDVLIGDVPNGSFRTPPFGVNRCIDRN
jgi:hypothetical protein